MSQISKNQFFAAAGNSAQAGLNVEEVFSTYLYDGTGATQSITNDIDLSGEGGMTWLKIRSLNGYDHSVYDTERGANKRIVPNSTGEEFTRSGGLTSFNSDGFTLGNAGDENQSGANIVSWTFRKAPKFFDVVTYTGTGSNQNISHSLGCVPGFVVVKKTSGTGNWSAWHRSLPDANDYILLNTTNGALDGGSSYNRSVTDTTYQVFGDYPDENQSGQTYVAYLFAHNDGDGEFGPTGDQDIIKCGSYTGNGSSINGPEIDLGFEPEWIVIKRTDAAGGWHIGDSMRGISNGSDDPYLTVSQSDEGQSFDWLSLSATGFSITTGSQNINLVGGSYIYIAIRRGPMAVPESATDVFAVQPWDGAAAIPQFVSGFPVDFAIHKNKTANSEIFSSARLTQQLYMETSTSLLLSSDTNFMFDYQNGYYDAATSANFVSWMWRRSPNFFDALFYRGDSVAGRQVPHNLGAVPEMIWVKRTDGAGNWWVYHKDQQASTVGGLRPPENSASRLDLDNIAVDGTNYWNDTLPSSTAFTVGNLSNTNGVGNDYMAYLFTSLAGISKCGGYIGNGTTLSIDCGFSAGTRLVIIKRTNATGGWFIFDSLRGMSSGNDSTLELNDSAPEVINEDVIEATTTGFNVINSGSTVDTNDLNDRYIFYAIAT